MVKINLYLVRHGQTYFNIFNKLQGWSNTPLTEKGINDAQKVAKRLSNIKFNAAYCSDTSRAELTTKIILDNNKNDSVKRPFVSSYFREEFYGYYEGNDVGQTWYVTGAPHGCNDFREIVIKYSMNKAKDFLKEADPFHLAENSDEYWSRITKGLNLIKYNKNLKNGDNVLIVTHGNTLLSLVDKFGKGNFDVTKRPKNGSITTMILDKDRINNIKVVDYNN